MSRIPGDRVIIGLISAVVILGAIFKPGMAGYLSILLTAVFVTVYWLTRSWRDRIFYLICTGALLVTICGVLSIWEALVISWMIAGIIAALMDISVSERDLPIVLAGLAVTFAVTLMIELANHVLFPLIVLCGISGILFMVMVIRDYRFRKQYYGGYE